MRQSFVILDDVIPGIDQLRDLALKQSYPPAPDTAYYPGRNSEQHFEIKGLHEQIEQVLGERLVPTRGASCHRFRRTLESEAKMTVHTDVCHWSAVLYLNLPEQCQGGTDFFRHKKSGLDQPPISEKELSQTGFSDPNDFLRKDTVPNAHNPDAWEHAMQLPMKYNRLVLFRPRFFHDAGQPFGSDLQSARLIYTMFFYSKAHIDVHGMPKRLPRN